ncbi:MAG: AEC family transporter [Pseudomonadota bacterium]
MTSSFPSLILLLSSLFGAVLIGVITALANIFSEEDARRFSRFIFTVAMPLAVFNFMRQNEIPGPEYIGLAAGYLIALATTASFAFWIARRFCHLSIRESGAAVFTTICGNAVFLGLPIALAIPGWGRAFLMLMVLEALFVFAIGAVLMTWPEAQEVEDKKKTDFLKIRGTVFNAMIRVARNPIIIAAFLGGLLVLFDLQLPPLVAEPLALFGGIASPLGLFVLGLYLVILPRAQEKMPWRLLISLLPLKLIFFPLLAAGLTYSFTGSATLTATIAFFTCLPPAVSSVVLAATYGTLERRTAAMVAVGSVVGLTTSTAYLFMAV